jgi:hypothetical protein
LHPKSLREICTALWRRALAAAVKDDAITDAEAIYLSELRVSLQINDEEAGDAERAIVHPKYRARLDQVLADGFLSDSEESELDALRVALRLSVADHQALYSPTASNVLTTELTGILSDQRVSPAELVRFAAKAKGIRIAPKLDPATESLIRRYGDFWKIENGDIPVVNCDIQLQRGETCHFQSLASWYEPRTKTLTTDLGSIGYSFRIARGVYYRSPRIRATRVRQDVLTLISEGSLYFTSKRVIFRGTSRNYALNLSSLLAYEVFQDGIKLEKASGRSPVLQFDGDVERAAVIFGALLAHA